MADHALVLAEGAVTETSVDSVTRRRFHNYAEYQALFGDCIARIAELALPRAKSAGQLPQAILIPLADRAKALGLAEARAA